MAMINAITIGQGASLGYGSYQLISVSLHRVEGEDPFAYFTVHKLLRAFDDEGDKYVVFQTARSGGLTVTFSDNNNGHLCVIRGKGGEARYTLARGIIDKLLKATVDN